MTSKGPFQPKLFCDSRLLHVIIYQIILNSVSPVYVSGLADPTQIFEA